MSKEEFMDKGVWIASRTDNPNRLGIENWTAAYDYAMSVAMRKDDVAGLSKDISKKMVAEFVSKNSLECDLNKAQHFSLLYSLFLNLSKENQVDSQNIQKILNMYSGKKDNSKTLTEKLSKYAEDGKNMVQKDSSKTTLSLAQQAVLNDRKPQH